VLCNLAFWLAPGLGTLLCLFCASYLPFGLGDSKIAVFTQQNRRLIEQDNRRNNTHIMSVFEAIHRVKELAAIECQRNPALHGQILEAIHKLQSDVESPFDTAMRVRFQVRRDLMRAVGLCVLSVW